MKNLHNLEYYTALLYHKMFGNKVAKKYEIDQCQKAGRVIAEEVAISYNKGYKDGYEAGKALYFQPENNY